MSKAIGSLQPLSSFLAFLVFQIAMTVQFVVALAILLLVFVSGDTTDGSDLLELIIKVFGLYFLASIAILVVAPFWGKKLIGAWTKTTPGYWRIAGLGVWLPVLFYILFNFITGLFSSNIDGSLWLLLSIIFQLLVVWWVSYLYYKKASQENPALFSTQTNNKPANTEK